MNQLDGRGVKALISQLTVKALDIGHRDLGQGQWSDRRRHVTLDMRRVVVEGPVAHLVLLCDPGPLLKIGVQRNALRVDQAAAFVPAHHIAQNLLCLFLRAVNRLGSIEALAGLLVASQRQTEQIGSLAAFDDASGHFFEPFFF